MEIRGREYTATRDMRRTCVHSGAYIVFFICTRQMWQAKPRLACTASPEDLHSLIEVSARGVSHLRDLISRCRSVRV